MSFGVGLASASLWHIEVILRNQWNLPFPTELPPRWDLVLRFLSEWPDPVE